MIQRSPNQKVPLYRNLDRINHPLIPCSSFPQNLASKFQESGILHTPPPFISHSNLWFSLRPPQQQPPLLPLPAAGRWLPTNRKPANNNNRTKRPNSYRKENKVSPPERVIIAKALPLISPGNIIPDDCKNLDANISDKFSGSVVFAISPPPSSLPLPRFSLRPNLCCKVEAAAEMMDTGDATDDLRRLLRLR